MSEHVPQPTPKRHIFAWLLGGCVVMIILGVVAFAMMFFGIGAMSRRSEPYKHAFALAENDARVAAALGRPIETTPPTMGGASENPDGTGYALLTIPIRGPKGDAILHVQATRANSRWRYVRISVGSKTIQPIDLLTPESSSTAPPNG